MIPKPSNKSSNDAFNKKTQKRGQEAPKTRSGGVLERLGGVLKRTSVKMLAQGIIGGFLEAS